MLVGLLVNLIGWIYNKKGSKRSDLFYFPRHESGQWTTSGRAEFCQKKEVEGQNFNQIRTPFHLLMLLRELILIF